MFAAMPVFALDPVAPTAERKFGMIYVKTPQPGSDSITLTAVEGGKTQKLDSEKEQKVPIGDYKISVKMQEFLYEQQVKVGGTERTEVIVPGYGNLKVISPEGSTVEVYKMGTESLVTKFPVKQVKILPSGYYDVRIRFGETSVTSNNVWIVTNTTREIEAKF